MSSGPTDIGITQCTASLVESIDWECKTEEKLIKATDGTFGQACAVDPIISFSVKGRGTSAVVLASASSTITAVTGTTIVNKVKQATKNDDYDTFEYSGMAYPGA